MSRSQAVFSLCQLSRVRDTGHRETVLASFSGSSFCPGLSNSVVSSIFLAPLENRLESSFQFHRCSLKHRTRARNNDDSYPDSTIYDGNCSANLASTLRKSAFLVKRNQSTELPPIISATCPSMFVSSEFFGRNEIFVFTMFVG